MCAEPSGAIDIDGNIAGQIRWYFACGQDCRGSSLVSFATARKSGPKVAPSSAELRHAILKAPPPPPPGPHPSVPVSYQHTRTFGPKPPIGLAPSLPGTSNVQAGYVASDAALDQWRP